MSTIVPQTTEEFQVWMLEKTTEMLLSQAAMNGKLDVSIANHNALKDRVKSIEDSAVRAKWWENAKVLAMLLVQAVIGVKLHKG
jgi:hypothetical protein